jgi:Immunity protein 10
LILDSNGSYECQSRCQYSENIAIHWGACDEAEKHASGLYLERDRGMTKNYQFSAHYIFVEDDDSMTRIGFADDEFSPSKLMLIQKASNVDERERAMGFEKLHIQIEDESRSRYGGITEIRVSSENLVVSLDQPARFALKIEGNVEIAIDPSHPVLERAISRLKKMCEREAVSFLG